MQFVVFGRSDNHSNAGVGKYGNCCLGDNDACDLCLYWSCSHHWMLMLHMLDYMSQSQVSVLITSHVHVFMTHISLTAMYIAEWLECSTQAQYGLGSNRSRDAVG